MANGFSLLTNTVKAGVRITVNISGFIYDDSPEENPMVALVSVFDDNNAVLPIAILESSMSTGAFSVEVPGVAGSTKYRLEMLSPNSRNSQVFSHVS